MDEVRKGWIFRLGKRLQDLEQACGCVCLGVLFVVMIVNAALRYLFKSGLNWSDEVNQFLFVWLGFLSAAYTMGDDRHLNVTAFVDLMPKWMQYVIRQMMNAIAIYFFLTYIPALVRLSGQLPISNVVRVPMKYVYAVMPVSFGLMAFHIVCNMIRDTERFFGRRKGTVNDHV